MIATYLHNVLTSGRQAPVAAYVAMFCLGVSLLLPVFSPAWGAPVDLTGTPVAAVNDQPCIGTRAGSSLGCTAKEFTVSTTFSAAPGTPPFCVAGNNFDFLVDMELSGSNANRYDITYYTGQTGNAPDVYDVTQLCSATAFPMTLPQPWQSLDGNLNSCADYNARGDSIVRVNRIKVRCDGDASGFLAVPYTLAYEQNTGNPTCVAGSPATYPIPTTSKCQTGISTVSGTVKVFSGAYVDVTKQTLPDGDGQAFTFSASGPAGSAVIALTGSTTLGLPTPTDGTYTPATAATATNSVSGITLTDGQTARFYINALAAAQTLTITEAATTSWETTASITCSNVSGTPNPTANNASRTITASLSTANSAAACTITNTKRSRITLQKSVNTRVNPADQFTVSASGGGTLTGTTSATTSGAGTSASTTFYSSPNAALTLTDAMAAGSPTPLAGYVSRLTCTNAFAGPGATPNASLPNGLRTTSTSITPAPGDDITCTYTNTKAVNLTLRKTWVNALVNDAVNVTGTGLTALASVADTASETDAGSVQIVPVGDMIAIGETFTAGSAANYNAALACTGTSGLSGTTLTVGSADANIVCTYTNTRKTANLTLRKTWVNATANDAVNVTATGLTTLASVANTASETDTGGVQTVRSGDVITLGETFTVGTAANYTAALACSGTSGLSGTTLTVGSADASIVCTYTNTFGGLPLLSILKSANAANANPGQTILYTVQISNSGAGAGANVVLRDDLSPYAAFRLDSYGAGVPFSFTDSAPASGLALGTPEYSTNNGATWGYTPVSGGGSAPAGYDGNITNWRIPMSGTIRSGGSFTLNYQVIVR
jgi:trimeric autotransporter adhesin